MHCSGFSYYSESLFFICRAVDLWPQKPYPVNWRNINYLGTGDTEIILAKLLGSVEEPSFQRLTLYIPDKDRDGIEIKELNKWIGKAREILTAIGGGATALPPADGTWLNPENSEIIWEKTTMIYTYVDPDKFEENIRSLRAFLHAYGLRTNQGEVVFEFDGRFYRIRKYDSK